MMRAFIGAVVVCLFCGLVPPATAAAAQVSDAEAMRLEAAAGRAAAGRAVADEAAATARTVQTAGTEVGCGTVVTTDVVLAEDLSCDGIALFIGAAGVTVDLDGHTVSSTGTAVFGDQAGYVLRDGTLRTTAPGAPAVAFLAFAADGLVERVTVEGVSGDGFGLVVGHGTAVRDSTFRGTGAAVDAYFAAGGVVVERSVFDGNRTGVNVAASNGTVITGSRFIGNGTGVRVWDESGFGASDTLVAGNHFHRNAVGVHVDAVRAAERTRVVDNRLLHQDGSGVLVTSGGGGAGTEVTDNHLVGNGFGAVEISWRGPEGTASVLADDGITVVAPASTVHVGGNRARRSAGLGIDAENAVDGGGNRAVASGDPRQCTGVVCRP